MELKELIEKMIEDSGNYIIGFDPDLISADMYCDDFDENDLIQAAKTYGVSVDHGQYIQKDLVIAYSAAARITVDNVKQYLEYADFRRGEGISSDDIEKAMKELDDGDNIQFESDSLIVYLEDLYWYINVSLPDLLTALELEKKGLVKKVGDILASYQSYQNLEFNYNGEGKKSISEIEERISYYIDNESSKIMTKLIDNNETDKLIEYLVNHPNFDIGIETETE